MAEFMQRVVPRTTAKRKCEVGAEVGAAQARATSQRRQRAAKLSWPRSLVSSTMYEDAIGQLMFSRVSSLHSRRTCA